MLQQAQNPHNDLNYATADEQPLGHLASNSYNNSHNVSVSNNNPSISVQ